MIGQLGKRLGLIILVAAILAGACVFTYNFLQPTIPDNLLFHDLKGKNVAFKNLKGEIGTVVIFTATWCAYCKQEIKAAKPIYEDNAPRGIQFLMVFQDYDSGDIRKYRKATKIPWPVVQKTDYVMKSFDRSEKGLPSAYFVASNGKIVASLTGKNSTLHYPEAIDLLFEEHFK